MKYVFTLAAVAALAGCATSSPGGLDDIVQGPTRICFDRTAFDLPPGGTIVEAERGRLGTHLTGMIGPNAFEITESGSFAPPAEAGATVYRGQSFHVRRVGNLPGSYAVFDGVAEGTQQPIVRIEHLFGTESVTFDQFFRTFDPEGAARGGCQRTFRYGS